MGKDAHIDKKKNAVYISVMRTQKCERVFTYCARFLWAIQLNGISAFEMQPDWRTWACQLKLWQTNGWKKIPEFSSCLIKLGTFAVGYFLLNRTRPTSMFSDEEIPQQIGKYFRSTRWQNWNRSHSTRASPVQLFIVPFSRKQFDANGYFISSQKSDPING